jgi:hypothetical protein
MISSLAMAGSFCTLCGEMQHVPPSYLCGEE